ncbi:MAG: hypothetical protein M3367_03120 [Acidobacteriota bacterium]|nr:hypothetical protein [Acidobacteriota bacterium]
MFGDWHEITDSIKSYPRKNQRIILAVLRYGSEKHVLQGQWDGEDFISFNGSTLWKDIYTVRYWMRMPDFPEGQKEILAERGKLLRKHKRTTSEE